MFGSAAALAAPVRLGLIGVGRIGVSHATLLAHRVAGATLVAVADTRPGAAEGLAATLGCAATSPSDLLLDPTVEGIVIAASSTAHADLIVAAAKHGKHVFCEKPMGMSLAEIDRAIAATDAAGVTLQVGFNRRFAPEFAAGRAVIDEGGVGTPQLMRSVTRDPGLANPAGVPSWTIFTQTLIHDFDTLLWLNPSAKPLTVHATADALVAPQFKDAGLLDTAVVVITFDNGAIAVAEASFSATYGYDVRGEVFGSAGMVTLGNGAASSLQYSNAGGRHQQTARGDIELLGDSYVAEFVEFTDAVRAGRPAMVTGRDARAAFTLALASIASIQRGATVHVREVETA